MAKRFFLVLVLIFCFLQNISLSAIFASDKFVFFNGLKKIKNHTVIAELVEGTSENNYSYYEVSDSNGAIYFRQNYSINALKIVFYNLKKSVMTKEDWRSSHNTIEGYSEYLKEQTMNSLSFYTIPKLERSKHKPVEVSKNPENRTTSMVLGSFRTFNVNIKKQTIKEVFDN